MDFNGLSSGASIILFLMQILYITVDANYRCGFDNVCQECPGGSCPISEVGNDFSTIFECQMICQHWGRQPPNPGRGIDAEPSSPAPIENLVTATGSTDTTELTEGFSQQDEVWACHKEVADGCQKCNILTSCKGFQLYRNLRDCQQATDDCRKPPIPIYFQCISGGDCVPCNDESPASTAPITCDAVLAIYDDKDTCNRVTGCTGPDWGKRFYQCTKGRGKSCTSCVNGKNCKDGLGGYLNKRDCERSDECSKSGSGKASGIAYQCPRGRGSGCTSCEKGSTCASDISRYASRAACELSNECTAPSPDKPVIQPPIRPQPGTAPPLPTTGDGFGGFGSDSTEPVGGTGTADPVGPIIDPTRPIIDPTGPTIEPTGAPTKAGIIDATDSTTESTEFGGGIDLGSSDGTVAATQPPTEEVPLWQCPGGADSGCRLCNVGGIACIPDLKTYSTDVKCLKSIECRPRTANVPSPGGSPGSTGPSLPSPGTNIGSLPAPSTPGKVCGVNEVVGCSDCENNCDDPFTDKYNCDRKCNDECRCIANGQFVRDSETGVCKPVENCFGI